MKVAPLRLIPVAGFLFVHRVPLLLGVLELFEQIWIEDGRADLVLAGGPLAEINTTAAIGAKRRVFGVEKDGRVTGGAAKGFGSRHTIFWMSEAYSRMRATRS